MNDRITRAIFNAVDELNEQLDNGHHLKKSLDTALFGSSAALDSLGLVNFIVITEERIEEEFGVIITLADERAMSQKNSPFKTIGSLSKYISLLLDENLNE